MLSIVGYVAGASAIIVITGITTIFAIGVVKVVKNSLRK